MATITQLKEEHKVSANRSTVDNDMLRGKENRSIALLYFTVEEGKSRASDVYAILAVGHYVRAAQGCEAAAHKALTAVERDLLLIKRSNIYKRAGIMLLKLGRSFEGIGLLRKSTMSELCISRQAHKYKNNNPVLM